MFIYHKILVALFSGGDGLSLEMILLLNFIPSLCDISSFYGVSLTENNTREIILL